MGYDAESYLEAKRRSDVVLNGLDLQTMVRRLAFYTEQTLKAENAPALVLPVMNGGAMLCYGMLMHWGFPFALDHVSASSYKGQSQEGIAIDHAPPRSAVEGRAVALVDDVIDSGRTFARLSRWAHNQGAAKVFWVVAGSKLPKPKLSALVKSAQVGCLSGTQFPNRWLFGFGMDLDGFGRDEPQILALPEDA